MTTSTFLGRFRVMNEFWNINYISVHKVTSTIRNAYAMRKGYYILLYVINN